MAALEEEKHEESFDEGMGNILADSPCCNICNHSFTDTADFVNHVKLHFGGPGKTSSNKRKAVDEIQPTAPAQKRHSPNKLTSGIVNSRQHKMVNSQHQRSPVNSNDQMIAFASQEEPEEECRQQGGQKSKGISTYPQSASLHSPPLPNMEKTGRRPSQSNVAPHKSPPAPGPQPTPPPMASSHPANLLELFTNQQILHQQHQHQQQQQQQQQQQLQAAAHFNSFNPFLPQYNPPHQVKIIVFF